MCVCTLGTERNAVRIAQQQMLQELNAGSVLQSDGMEFSSEDGQADEPGKETESNIQDARISGDGRW
jgi:hypothetical protein